MSLKLFRNIIIISAFLVVAFGTGYRIGSTHGKQNATGIPTSASVISKSSDTASSVDFSLFWDVWDRLGQSYVDKAALAPQSMVYGAISGMVSALDDPYTVFLPPDQNRESKEDLSGKFEGIGAQLGIKEKKIVVIAPLKDSPAQKAGLRPGDWIVKVDDKETMRWTLPEAVSKIRGPKGSTVRLSIVHEEASKSTELAVRRDTINVVSVEWEQKAVGCQGSGISTSEPKNCTVIYLKLGRFGDPTNAEWDKAVTEITEAMKRSNPSTPLRVNDQAIKGLVLDLRNNPGGYLSGSVYITSEFLPDGTIVTQEHADGNKQTFTVNRKGRLLKIPMIVLVNKGSASASEIVAGALRDRGRANLVGETTFGKGSIQEVQELPGGAGIHITVAKWLLPSGAWINGKGLTPEILVENDDAKPDEDKQLERAIEELLK